MKKDIIPNLSLNHHCLKFPSLSHVASEAMEQILPEMSKARETAHGPEILFGRWCLSVYFFPTVMNKEKVILAWLWCRMFQMLATRWRASKVLGYLINRLSVQFSCLVMCNSLWPHGLQHARPPCASPPPGAYSNSCPLSRGYHPTISSSVVPSSSYLQSFPASGSFLMNRFFPSGSQSVGASTSASVLLMTIQDWFPLGLTGMISLQSKGLSRVFSNTTVQKHQFFGTQLSLWSNSHIHTWLLEKP